MNSLGFEYQSEFARRYYGQGKAEGLADGRVEGRVEVILKQLTYRFGPLSDAIQTRVRGAKEAQLDLLSERLLTARTLEETLHSLSWVENGG